MPQENPKSNSSGASGDGFSEHNFSRLIAMAGRQRMLSQRAGLALLLVSTSLEEGSASDDVGLSLFCDVTEQFASAHSDIIRQVAGSDVARARFPATNSVLYGEDAVSALLSRFIADAQRICRGGISGARNECVVARLFARRCMEGVLVMLEAVVSAIQADYDGFLDDLSAERQQNAQIISKSVDEIVAAAAFSRMVALNAKISAARAGEFGAEFSALTNEIKDVADRIVRCSGIIRERV